MIQLQLDLNEVNQILESLGQRPYKEVFQLIIKIQQQAESQLKIEDQLPVVGGTQPKEEQS